MYSHTKNQQHSICCGYATLLVHVCFSINHKPSLGTTIIVISYCPGISRFCTTVNEHSIDQTLS